MTRKSLFKFLAVCALGLSTLACSLGGKINETATPPPVTNVNKDSTFSENKNINTNESESEQSNSNSSNQGAEFPIPDKADVIQSSPDLVMGTVKMSKDDIVAFYRKELKTQGLSEDTLLTTFSDSTYSLVFKGTSNGKSVVVQGTKLDKDTIAFSIRYE
jgi:hypothetical protein